MNNELLTVTLLIVIASSVGILYLWFWMLQSVSRVADLLHLVLHRLSDASQRQRSMKHALLEDGKVTRERIAQVKTRLADEERDDQRAKASARQKGVRS
jgi:hypothetical protein